MLKQTNERTKTRQSEKIHNVVTETSSDKVPQGQKWRGQKVPDTCIVLCVFGLKAHAVSPVTALLCPEPRIWVNGCDVHGYRVPRDSTGSGLGLRPFNSDLVSVNDRDTVYLRGHTNQCPRGSSLGGSLRCPSLPCFRFCLLHHLMYLYQCWEC